LLLRAGRKYLSALCRGEADNFGRNSEIGGFFFYLAQ